MWQPAWELTAICAVFKVVHCQHLEVNMTTPELINPILDQACWISNQHQDSVRFNLFVSFQLVLCYNWLRTYFLWSSAMFPSLILDSNFCLAVHFLCVGVSLSDCLRTSVSIMILVTKEGIPEAKVSLKGREIHWETLYTWANEVVLFIYLFIALEHLWGSC